jgi:hypothetical protein
MLSRLAGSGQHRVPDRFIAADMAAIFTVMRTGPSARREGVPRPETGLSSAVLVYVTVPWDDKPPSLPNGPGLFGDLADQGSPGRFTEIDIPAGKEVPVLTTSRRPAAGRLGT